MNGLLRFLSPLVSVAFYIASGAAVILWGLSAAVPVPVPTFDMGNLTDALKSAAHWNAWAAGVTGLSVFLSLVRELLRREPGAPRGVIVQPRNE